MKPQDWLQVLTDEVAKRGLPREVGARGWIQQSMDFWHNDNFLGTGIDGLKGWIFLNRDPDDYNEEHCWQDLEGLVDVVENFVSNNTDGETGLYVGPDGERLLTLINEEADGKSWEHTSDMDDDELFDYVRQVLEEAGEEVDPDEDPDLNYFFWDYCEQRGGETEYDLSYGVAWIEFDDGFKIGLGSDYNGGLKLIKYGDQDIRDDEKDNVVRMDGDADSRADWPFPNGDEE
jgi:hypothetical protein